MKSIIWNISRGIEKGDEARLISEFCVEELTVSKVFVPYIQIDGVHKFRFFNTDPENWNLYMFPYVSQKIRKKVGSDQIIRESNSAAGLMGGEGEDYIAFSNNIVQPQAEVKHSKSSGRDTLYLFFYKVVDPNLLDFEYEFIDVNFSGNENVESYFEAEGSAFASNIPSIVQEVVNGRS